MRAGGEFSCACSNRAVPDRPLADGIATGPTGQTKVFDYDDQGRLTGVALPTVVIDPLPDGVYGPELTGTPQYEYGYDAFGNMVSITDPLDRTTWFTFDDQGRQLTRTLPLGVETWESDVSEPEVLRSW